MLRRLMFHTATALLLGLCSVFLLEMPDGTGPVQPVDSARAERLIASDGKLRAVLDMDPGSTLRSCQHELRGEVPGPESVGVHPNGSLMVLDRTGVLHRAEPRGMSFTRACRVAFVGPGRPLGYHVTADGEAIVICDSLKGLTQLHLATGRLEVLSNARAFANDVDVEQPRQGQGKVYFTSSSVHPVLLNQNRGGGGADTVFGDPFYDTMDGYMRCLARGDATGALLEYDPTTRATATVIGGLWFANGVALSADGTFAAVVETLGFRVLRVWLKGPRRGEADTLIGTLPGFPDGISRSADGNHFWLAIVAPWTPMAKVAHLRVFRAVLVRFRRLARKIVKPLGLVLKVRASDGEIARVLADPGGKVVQSVSAVEEHRGRLFLGQLEGDSVVSCQL